MKPIKNIDPENATKALAEEPQPYQQTIKNLDHLP